MLDATTTTWAVLGGFGLVTICISWVLISLLRKQSIQLAKTQAQVDTLSSNLSALCAGVAGGNKRLNQIEKCNRDLQTRQEHMEIHEQNDGAYGEAIQMVRHGATAAHLMEKLGLGSNEANLIVMLHGMKETG